MEQALIFDFDGLILDTELADYQSWSETYAAYGIELPLALWQSGIGTIDAFNPYEYLEQQLQRSVDRRQLHDRRKARDNELIAQLTVLPGVLDLMAEARHMGYRLAIASSASHRWVDSHLQRLDLQDAFEAVCCRDDVDNRAKPHPAVYQLALQRLGVTPERAVALEDSPHGVTAARAAGIYVVAIPNQMTRPLDFSHANQVLSSLTQLSLPVIQP